MGRTLASWKNPLYDEVLIARFGSLHACT